MKLYLISQNANNDYDTYDSAIVAANNEDEARRIHPGGSDLWDEDNENWYRQYQNNERYTSTYSSWALVKDVQAEYIGEAHKTIKAGVVLASFNAG